MDWSGLSGDILQLIAKKVVRLSDHIRFCGVCASWRAAGLLHRFNLPPQVPGLVIAGSDDPASLTRRFLIFPDDPEKNRQQNSPSLPVPHDDVCRGSLDGWLVMVDKGLGMYLLNPFSGFRIELPPVTALKPPHHNDTPMDKWYIKWALLSTSPSKSISDCTILIHYTLDQLAFCRVGDTAWTFIQPGARLGYYKGVYFGGQFHLVDWYGRILTCDLDAIPPVLTELTCQPKLSIFVQRYSLVEVGSDLVRVCRKVAINDEEFYNSSENENENENEDEYEGMGEDDHGNNNNENAVEAYDADGTEDNDLGNRMNEDGNGNENEIEDENEDTDDAQYDPGDFIHRTGRFKLCKLDSAKRMWIPVKNLGHYALFIGYNAPIVVSEVNVPSIKGNQIYYTDDISGIGEAIYERSGYDVGIFNLRNSSQEPLYAMDSELTKPTAVWVTPLPW